MQIFVLVILHKHGANISTFSTREKAASALADYARDNWEPEGPEGDPSDQHDEEVVDTYFKYMDGDESYTIEETVLDRD